MIRPIPTSRDPITGEEGPTAYALTRKGVAWIALEQGMVFAAIALGVLALGHGNKARDEIVQSRKNGIVIACREANQRHAKATFFLTALVAKNPKNHQTKQEKAKADEQLSLFVEAVAPAYVAGSPKLSQATRERLGCEQRVREFSKS